MTVKDIIEMAHNVHNGWADSAMSRAFAGYVLDLLGVDAVPCGMVEPELVPPPGDGTDGVIVIHTDTPGVYVASEARSYAIALLRLADQAEAK